MNVLESEPGLELAEVAIDEALIAETSGALKLRNVVIGQLDARGADLRKCAFDEACHVVSLIADDGTLLPEKFPRPSRIQLPEKVLAIPTEIEKWLYRHSSTGQRENTAAGVIPADVRGNDLLELVGRVSRYKSFWLKQGDDKSARRILDDPNWEKLREIVDKHDLLTTKENIGASGRPSTFYHLRRKNDILTEKVEDPQIANFYRSVVKEINAQKS